MEIIMHRSLLKIIAIITPCIIMFTGCKNSRDMALEKAFASYTGRYAIVIDKRAFKLTVYGRDMKSIADYRIGYGSNPDMKPKLYEGDDRTPEGVYSVNEILSMDAGRDTESYRKLMKMNQIYFRASAGFHRYGKPDEDLADNAYGPRYYGIDYPGSDDIARYNKALAEKAIPAVKGKIPGIGYGIAIHGNNDEDSIGHLCSSGCVRMYNRDIVELEKYVSIGTPVIIY